MSETQPLKPTPHSHEALYGLRVIKYSYSDIKLPEGEENWNTLIDNVIVAVQNLRSLIDSEINTIFNGTHTKSNDEFNSINVLLRELDSTMIQLAENLNKIRKSLEVRYNARAKRIQREAEGKEPSTEAAMQIEQFFGEFRGLLLTFYHNLDMTTKFLELMQFKRNKKRHLIHNPFSSSKYSVSDYEYQLKKQIKKHKVFVTLAKMSVIITTERENTCVDCFFPFSNSIDVADYEEITNLDTKEIMEDLGTQFVPMLQKFFSLMVKVTASYATGVQWEANGKHPYVKKAAFAVSNLYYIANADAAASRTTKFFSNTISSSAGRDLWELQDAGMIKTFMYLSMPYVEVSTTFRIPSFYTPSELELQEKRKSGGFLSKLKLSRRTSASQSNTPISPLPIMSEQDHKEQCEQELKTIPYRATNLMENMEQDLSENHNVDSKTLDEGAPDAMDCDALEGKINMDEFKKFYNAIKKYDSYVNHKNPDVMLRLISAKPLQSSLSDVTTEFPYLQHAVKLIDKAKGYIPTRISNYLGTVDPDSEARDYKVKRSKSTNNMPRIHSDGNILIAKPPVKPSKSLIFHIHGGGFIAMSSFSHESYLRHWTMETGMPILSVDYSKAPESRFPVALEEVFTAYKWAITNTERILGAPLKKIIVAGDSAGGNLALALTIKLIQEGERIPDGLGLSYPATFVFACPSPARIVSMIDPLVNLSFLAMCAVNYTDTINDQKRDPLISPCVAPDQILAKFPPTYINVGSLDPLFDDSCYMARRIAKNNGGKVKLEIMDGVGHGYLNMLEFLPEAKAASGRLARWMKRIAKAGVTQVENASAEIEVEVHKAKEVDQDDFVSKVAAKAIPVVAQAAQEINASS